MDLLPRILRCIISQKKTDGVKLWKKQDTSRSKLSTSCPGGISAGVGKEEEGEACHELISDATCHKWSREYSGMGVSQAKKLERLEMENVRLKRVVMDLALDNGVLKDIAERGF